MKKYCILALAVCIANIATKAADAGYNYITSRQISALRAEQVASIKQADLQKLSADLIASLINPYRNDDEPRLTGRVMVREWEQNHGRVMPRLTNFQITQLSDAKISSLSSYDLKNIEPQTLERINVNACAHDTMNDLLSPQRIQDNAVMTYSYHIPAMPSLLSDNQILGLQPQQFTRLRCDDLHNIAEQTIKKLKVEQVNSFCNQSIAYLINPRCFVAIPPRPQLQNIAHEQPLISREQFNNLELNKLIGLSPEVFSQLPNDYIGMLRDDQKVAMYPGCLIPERFAQLANNELQALTDDQLKRLNLRQIQALNQEQLQLFRLNQIPVKGINFAGEVRSIPPVCLRALDNEELSRLLFS